MRARVTRFYGHSHTGCLRGGVTSTGYTIAYALGVTPWERAGTMGAAALDEVIARTEDDSGGSAFPGRHVVDVAPAPLDGMPKALHATALAFYRVRRDGGPDCADRVYFRWNFTRTRVRHLDDRIPPIGMLGRR